MITLLIIITLIALLIASVTDIKTREVPDWLSYGLIFTGFGVRLIYSLGKDDYSYVINGAIGFAVIFGISYLMYKAGQWGGGDAKIMMGLGALIGMEFNKNALVFQFLVLIVIIGSVYGLLYSAILIFIHRKKFAAKFKSVSQKYRATKKLILTIALVLILSSFFFPAEFRMGFYLITLILVSTFYILIFAKVAEQCCMEKWVEVKGLTEGDWIVHNINIDGNYIAGPKDLGISRAQIAKLVKLKQHGKISKVLIKEGIPFVPSFFLAYITALILQFLNINLITLFL